MDGKAAPVQKLKFPGQSYANLTPELMFKSMWTSTVLAIIFALPPVGLFLGLYQADVNIGIGAGVSFGLHFAILAFSKKISGALVKLFA
jgi:hypothetical protein